MMVGREHYHQPKSLTDRKEVLGEHLGHIGKSPQSTFGSFDHITNHLIPLLFRFLGSKLLSLLLTKLGINMDLLTGDDHIRRSLSLGMSCIANINFRYRSIIIGTVRVGIFDLFTYSGITSVSRVFSPVLGK
jgi:hypothetical protein